MSPGDQFVVSPDMRQSCMATGIRTVTPGEAGEGRLPPGGMMWLVFASVLTLMFAPMRETVRMAQVHVLTGPERRRRFSLEENRAHGAAAFAPGAVVSEVARWADVCASLIYRWRREMGAAIGFAEVIVERPGGACGGEVRWLSALPPVEAARPAGADAAVPAIEVELAGSSRVRIPASIPPDLAAAVIAALRRRSPLCGADDSGSERGAGVAGGRTDGHAARYERTGAAGSGDAEAGSARPRSLHFSRPTRTVRFIMPPLAESGQPDDLIVLIILIELGSSGDHPLDP